MLHISCDIGTFALSDMSALAHSLGCCANISGNVLIPVLQLLYDIRSYHNQNFVPWL